jgi:hypothetical protein
MGLQLIPLYAQEIEELQYMALPLDEFLSTFNIACTHALATRQFSSHRQSGRISQDPHVFDHSTNISTRNWARHKSNQKLDKAPD